jgi:hypothetical protein
MNVPSGSFDHFVPGYFASNFASVSSSDRLVAYRVPGLCEERKMKLSQ